MAEEQTKNESEELDNSENNEISEDHSEAPNTEKETTEVEVESESSDKVEEMDDSTSESDVKQAEENSSTEESNDEAKVEEEISPALDSYPILIIDDDRWLQRIFYQYLKSWGFTHVQAMNSFEGVDQAIKTKPLLIFLDIIMPDVTGDITLKFLKGIESLKDVPVVIISGNLNKEVLKTTYKDGAAGFISKPFTKDILYNKIKDVLDPKIFNRMVKDGLLELQVAKKVHLTGM